MSLKDLWYHLQFVTARERVHIETARRAQAALEEAGRYVQAVSQEKGTDVPELADRCRRLASSLFVHYGPERRGSRLFILAKKRGRLHSIAEAAGCIRSSIQSELVDDRELASSSTTTLARTCSRRLLAEAPVGTGGSASGSRRR